MTSKISSILDILNDGKWHTRDEIARNAGISEAQLKRVIDFLMDYDFIRFDQEEGKVKLRRTAKDFLTHIVTA